MVVGGDAYVMLGNQFQFLSRIRCWDSRIVILKSFGNHANNILVMLMFVGSYLALWWSKGAVSCCLAPLFGKAWAQAIPGAEVVCSKTQHWLGWCEVGSQFPRGLLYIWVPFPCVGGPVKYDGLCITTNMSWNCFAANHRNYKDDSWALNRHILT